MRTEDDEKSEYILMYMLIVLIVLHHFLLKCLRNVIDSTVHELLQRQIQRMKN